MQKNSLFTAGEFQDDINPFLCKFCGGQSCAQEDYNKNTKQPNAIEGLHSNWISDKILAMQRPSERLIAKYDLYAKLKQAKIGTILNVQEAGQHAACGDGIIASVGFSYRPEGFSAQGILWFNEGWEDMTAPSFQQMMRIMDVFDLAMSRGCIAVHCHAGRGRTLLVICAWLIYHQHFSASQVIQLALDKRQGALSKTSQRAFLFSFQQQILQRVYCFYKQPTAFDKYSDFAEWQSKGNLTRVKKELHFRPHAHLAIMNNLLAKMHSEKSQIVQALIDSHGQFFPKPWSSIFDEELVALKQKCNKKEEWNANSRLVAQLLYDYYDQMPLPVISSHTVQSISHEHTLQTIFTPFIVDELGIHGIAVILDLAWIAQQLQAQQIIFIRFAFMLLSKRKYFPKLFVGRKCHILKLLSQQKEITHIVTPCIKKFAYFLMKLSKELPKERQELEKLILNARKIDIKLYTSQKQAGKDYYNKKDLQMLYNSVKK